ncbi:transcriptional regulator, TetR family [Halopseudomonas xinjiangensis]|uniref:Transcriptional regulator, TetR family n=1 Tax=Halopseudomonas xinjiangensis TaxID=487184 RepID=A0A1H1QI30_9GAMM|nr:TetR/AcrR family transcriptional regulator [Halopseudomonas xinjiangensis]SDS23128.1 transcriptional regulator, TetR family [Halopseudomonas xinjiangensis]
MPAASQHRLNIVRAAARLFRQQGYARTGLNDILAVSKAPKGSLYHYFPNGKEQLGEEALRYAAQQATDTLTGLRAEHATAPALLMAFANLLAEWLAASAYQDGCPMATTILETVPRASGLTSAAQAGFAAWSDIFEQALLADGAKPDDARRLARLSIATLEGSLIQARVEQSSTSIIESAEEVAGLMRARSKHP